MAGAVRTTTAMVRLDRPAHLVVLTRLPTVQTASLSRNKKALRDRLAAWLVKDAEATLKDTKKAFSLFSGKKDDDSSDDDDLSTDKFAKKMLKDFSSQLDLVGRAPHLPRARLHDASLLSHS